MEFNPLKESEVTRVNHTINKEGYSGPKLYIGSATSKLSSPHTEAVKVVKQKGGFWV